MDYLWMDQIFPCDSSISPDANTAMTDIIPQKLNKVCFVSLYTYPLFNPENQSPFGGSEVRVAMITKELARRGNLDISVIVFDHGQPHIEIIDNVRIVSWKGLYCRESVNPSGISVSLYARAMSLISRTITRFIQAIRPTKNQQPVFGKIGQLTIFQPDISTYDEVDADIYVIVGNGELTAKLAYFCKRKGKKFVLLSGSDMDFDPKIKSNPSYVNSYGVSGYSMQYALENFDLCLVQTEHQQNLLSRNFQKKSMVIRNPVDIRPIFPRQHKPETILWVGKSDQIKRPELVLDLAEIFPQYPFTLILNLSKNEIYADCISRAKTLPNVTILPYVPPDQIEKYFAEARLLVNTSQFEGFPNTFLQAAKYGVPIISLNVDPGGMLSQHGCGKFCEDNFEFLKNGLFELVTNKAGYQKASRNGLEYASKYHDKEKITEQYESAFLSIQKT